MSARVHHFYAVAFEENLSLKELTAIFPTGKLTLHELHVPCGDGGLHLYPFGALVAYDVTAEVREAELSRLFEALPKLTTTRIVREEYTVREDPSASTGMSNGVLSLDRFTPKS